jgi:nitrogen regulatory protein P-II 1
MKNLTIVIHASAEQALADHLRTLEQVQGFTFTHVEGHSDHSENDPFLSARDRVVGYVPRVRLDVLLAAADVSAVLTALLAQESFRGQGVYWVSPVEQQGRL